MQHSREVKIPQGTCIISTTDINSIITSCNEAFVEYSGFSTQELIGQPHNILRHPDMPKEAFAEMWSRLKAGKCWQGVVKNKCKNGDFYWVRAFVAPVIENDEIVGYQSVRQAPHAQEISRATKLYAGIKQGRVPIQFTEIPLLTRRILYSAILFLSLITLGYFSQWLSIALLLVFTALSALVFKDYWFDVPDLIEKIKEEDDLAHRKIAFGTGGKSIIQFSNAFLDTKSFVLKSRLMEASTVIDGVAEKTATSARQSEHGAQAQALITHQLVDVIDELSQASSASETRLHEAAHEMQNCENVLSKSAQDIGKQVDHIRELAEDIASATQLADELSEQSTQVGNVVSVIVDIADQTNLLALNASIEAARAGESGRGFAVVAQEVRDLSIKTAKSADSINSQIATMTNLINRWALNMGTHSENASRTADESEQLNQLMQDIKQSNSTLSQALTELAHSSGEQQNILSQATNKLHEVGNVTDDAKDAAGNVLSQTEHLNEQIHRLAGIARTFS